MLSASTRPPSWQKRACLRSEAARVLACRFGCSPRQARRYAAQAAASGRVPVPEATVVFTVKVPPCSRPLSGSMPACRRTISAVVAQALTEFLSRDRRNHPRR